MHFDGKRFRRDKPMHKPEQTQEASEDKIHADVKDMFDPSELPRNDSNPKKDSQLELKFCEYVLAELQSPDHHEVTVPFFESEALAAEHHNYGNRIDVPMNPCVIEKKQNDGKYRTSAALKADLDQLSINCFRWHLQSDERYELGQAFKKLVDKLFASKAELLRRYSKRSPGKLSLSRLLTLNEAAPNEPVSEVQPIESSFPRADLLPGGAPAVGAGPITHNSQPAIRLTESKNVTIATRPKGPIASTSSNHPNKTSEQYQNAITRILVLENENEKIRRNTAMRIRALEQENTQVKDLCNRAKQALIGHRDFKEKICDAIIPILMVQQIFAETYEREMEEYREGKIDLPDAFTARMTDKLEAAFEKEEWASINKQVQDVLRSAGGSGEHTMQMDHDIREGYITVDASGDFDGMEDAHNAYENGGLVKNMQALYSTEDMDMAELDNLTKSLESLNDSPETDAMSVASDNEADRSQYQTPITPNFPDPGMSFPRDFRYTNGTQTSQGPAPVANMVSGATQSTSLFVGSEDSHMEDAVPHSFLSVSSSEDEDDEDDGRKTNSTQENTPNLPAQKPGAASAPTVTTSVASTTTTTPTDPLDPSNYSFLPVGRHATTNQNGGGSPLSTGIHVGTIIPTNAALYAHYFRTGKTEAVQVKYRTLDGAMHSLEKEMHRVSLIAPFSALVGGVSPNTASGSVRAVVLGVFERMLGCQLPMTSRGNYMVELRRALNKLGNGGKK